MVSVVFAGKFFAGAAPLSSVSQQFFPARCKNCWSEKWGKQDGMEINDEERRARSHSA